MKKRAFRRKRYNRKRPFYRNRKFRRSVPRFRRPGNVYNFKRTVELENFPVAAGQSFSSKGYYFKFSDIPSMSEFTNLFDSFRILAVKITFYPPYNIAWLPASANAPIGEFYSIIDYNDAVSPSSTSDMNQYQTLHRTWANRPHRRYLKPKLLQTGLVNGDTTFSALTTVNGKPWLDMYSSQTARYYGVKIAWASSVGSDVKAFDVRVTATYYFQGRYVK